ncbi:hypothetical protein BDN72DRAFT_794484 [Pluteus cervinus]|uniref:Uncharacterized protein n=1 Tax=Pluteus cervinus TaxID=181527 RepID=A0ACD3AZ65_9AGAR|nr:hypothetical protein BDN72DRAFT_794484 [Pluteus cervinus]
MALHLDQNTINAPGACFSAVGPGGAVNNNQQYLTTNRNDNRQQNRNTIGILNLTIGKSTASGDGSGNRQGCLTELTKRMAPGASYDAAQRGDPPPRCHEETRKVIRSQLTTWCETMSSDSSDCVRLLTGPAGTGKSAIVQTVVEELVRKNRLAASFFFMRANSDLNTINKFVPSIAYQLAMTHAEFRAIVTDVLAVDTAVFKKKTIQGQWQKLVLDPLCRMKPSPTPIVIVIDGIDQCRSPSQQIKLLKLVLDSTKQLGSSVRFLIGARPEPRIIRVFDESGLDDAHRIRLGESESDYTDISTFLRFSFNRIYDYRQQHHTLPSFSSVPAPWPSAEILNELVQRAAGKFAFAVEAISFVDNDNEDPRARLQLLMNPSPRTYISWPWLSRVFESDKFSLARAIRNVINTSDFRAANSRANPATGHSLPPPCVKSSQINAESIPSTLVDNPIPTYPTARVYTNHSPVSTSDVPLFGPTHDPNRSAIPISTSTISDNTYHPNHSPISISTIETFRTTNDPFRSPVSISTATKFGDTYNPNHSPVSISTIETFGSTHGPYRSLASISTAGMSGSTCNPDRSPIFISTAKIYGTTHDPNPSLASISTATISDSTQEPDGSSTPTSIGTIGPPTPSTPTLEPVVEH